MLEFNVQDMTCGHCASMITKAVKQVDPKAAVDIDIGNHLVRIDGASDANEIEEAIREAGYTPVARA